MKTPNKDADSLRLYVFSKRKKKIRRSHIHSHQISAADNNVLPRNSNERDVKKYFSFDFDIFAVSMIDMGM